MWHLCESLILSCGFSCLYLLGCSTSHTQLQGKFFVAFISVAQFPASFERGSEIFPHSELTLQPSSGGFKQLFFLSFLRLLTFINQPRSLIFCAASVHQWHDYQNLLVLESDSFPRLHPPPLFLWPTPGLLQTLLFVSTYSFCSSSEHC